LGGVFAGVKNKEGAERRWLMSVILATQEAESRIAGVSQPQANSWRDCILKKPTTEKAWQSGSDSGVPA
jgi:hypothetical protein